MSFDSDYLLERLDQLIGPPREDMRFLIAYSGGLDSSVLLHALSQSSIASERVLAIHVNHGLHPDADSWELHCRRFAESLGVKFDAIAVVVDERSGLGLEAAAREARYAALMNFVHPQDCLLSAHHQDDQAETLLLNLMRGSGISGMAGIGKKQPFGPGQLLRPLLGVSRSALEDYAERHAVERIDDPANEDQQFDRNFLRREILPRLTERWPAAAARLARSAELAADSADLLQSLAEVDLEDAEPSKLDIKRLRDLPETATA